MCSSDLGRRSGVRLGPLRHREDAQACRGQDSGADPQAGGQAVDEALAGRVPAEGGEDGCAQSDPRGRAELADRRIDARGYSTVDPSILSSVEAIKEINFTDSVKLKALINKLNSLKSMEVGFMKYDNLAKTSELNTWNLSKLEGLSDKIDKYNQYKIGRAHV